MTWGMHEPSRFGEFFPDVDYVGWKEAINQYYDTVTSDSEKAAIGVQKRILYSKFTAKFTRDLGPLNDAECPKEFQAVKSYKTLGSLIKLNDRMLAVDAQLKAILEELEPNVHQFWLIKISMPRNKVYPGAFYGLRIGQFLDAFDPNHSDDGSYNVSGYENYRGIAPIKKAITGLALSQEAIGGAHLWREKKLTQPDIFLSDTLQSRAVEQGLRLPKHFQTKEV